MFNDFFFLNNGNISNFFRDKDQKWIKGSTVYLIRCCNEVSLATVSFDFFYSCLSGTGTDDIEACLLIP